MTRSAREKLLVLSAWILALLLVAGTFAVGRTQAQDRPPSDRASITWWAEAGRSEIGSDPDSGS